MKTLTTIEGWMKTNLTYNKNDKNLTIEGEKSD